MTFAAVVSLLKMLSLPAKMLHKKYIESISTDVLDCAMQHIVDAPDQQLKKLTPDEIGDIGKNFSALYKRLDNNEKVQEAQLLICKKCLESEALTVRIQSIKDLNSMLRSSAKKETK